MIPRVAVLNRNVSGATSTTGSHLDTNCCVYMEIQSSCTHPANSQRKAKGEYGGHLVEVQTIANDCSWSPRDALNVTATTTPTSTPSPSQVSHTATHSLVSLHSSSIPSLVVTAHRCTLHHHRSSVTNSIDQHRLHLQRPSYSVQ